MSDLRTLFSIKDLTRFALLVVILLIGTVIELTSLAAVPVFVSLVTMPGEDTAAYQAIARALTWLSISAPSNLPFWGGLVLILLFVIRTVYLIGSYIIQEHILANRHVEVSSRLFRAYLNAPFEFHLQRNSSDLTNNIVLECEHLIRYILDASITFCRQTIIIIAIISLLLWYDPIVSLASFAALAILAGSIMICLNRTITQAGTRLHEARQQALQGTLESLSAYRDLQILNCLNHAVARMHTAFENIARCQKYCYVLSKSMWPFMELATVVVLLGAMIILFVIRGNPVETAPTIALIAVCLARLKGTITELMLSITYFKTNSVLLHTIAHDLRVLDPPRSDEKDANTPVALSFQRSIRLQDIHFTYKSASAETINGISFAIPFGRSVAIVGSTGSGKTTIANIIVGLLTPQSGTITIDDTVLTPATLRAWQNTIGYVAQDTILLDATIRDNIAFGIPADDIDETALADAVTAAQLDDFLATLPEGLSTIVGERGVRLSGGQRQRIAIARALYRKPTFLMFDEATSALDNTTEKAVVDAISALRGKHTIVVVAHRLSTIKDCDTILFLKNGCIAASGTYESLQKTLPDFARMSGAL